MAQARDASGNVLVSKMFCGRYIETGVNIGHEVINFFRADDGSVYYYIPDTGNARKEFGRGARVLLVGPGGNGNQVYAQAVVEERICEVREDVTYGGATLDDIFSKNSYGSNYEGTGANKITFKVRDVKVPKNENGMRIFYSRQRGERQFSEGDLRLTDEGGGYANMLQRQRAVLVEGEEEKDEIRRELLRALDDDALWKEGDLPTVEEAVDGGGLRFGHASRIWSLLRSGKDELSYSNVIAYLFLNHPGFLRVFLDAVFEIFGISKTDGVARTAFEDVERGEYSVLRESNDIDILVTTESSFFVIENKIDSDIQAYDPPKDGHTTQLDKYWDICANGELKEKLKDRRGFYVVLAPNYKRLGPFGRPEMGGNFKPLRYGDIAKRLEGVREEGGPEGRRSDADRVFEEFSKQIETLCFEEDNKLRFEMMSRFADIVSHARKR